jgi:anaerobic selenocysteine-containing dehydrogenase
VIGRYFQFLELASYTSSGKVEIYSEGLKKHGYDPIPTFREPAETPIDDPRLAKEDPLVLTTGTKIDVFHHSEYRNIRSLRSLAPEPFFEINSSTAGGLNIEEIDEVSVESLSGRDKIRSHVTDHIISGVVSIAHG